MTRLPLALLLAAIFFCLSAYITQGAVEPIVTICTTIVAVICVLAGFTMMEWERVAMVVAAVRRTWITVTLWLAAAMAIGGGVYLALHGDRVIGVTSCAGGCVLVYVIAWRDVRRGAAPTPPEPEPNEFADAHRAFGESMKAAGAAFVRPEVHQLTSDITPPQPHSRPDVGEERKRRARRMTDDRRNAQKKGYGN